MQRTPLCGKKQREPEIRARVASQQMLSALVAALAAIKASPCDCDESTYASSIALTCSAYGDPHYKNFASEKYDYYGRGLYEHSRFSIDACGCDVRVQTLLVGLISGWPANSAIAATAVIIGDTTFKVTAAGVVSVSGGGHTAALQPASEASVAE